MLSLISRASRSPAQFARCALVAVAAAFALGAGAAHAESRVALVIGNGAYKQVPALDNPPNDARDVAQALTFLGFKVTLLIDADRARFEKEVEEFGRVAKASDVSMFYYGGHGLQMAARNYLLPVDASIHKAADIQANTVPLNAILDAQTGGPGIHLVFLDACRNDPTGGNVSAPGLAKAGSAAGFLIAYATQPDNVALDGAGRNSPFAKALLHHMATPGVDISKMLIEVRNDVLSETGSSQTTWDGSSLTRQFYFLGDQNERASQEALLWRQAAREKDAELLAYYLDKYPKGPHAEDVRALLPSPKAVASPEPKAPSLPDDPDLWTLALSSRDRTLARIYRTRYPSGAYAQQAGELLASLEAAEAAATDPAGVCEKLATHPHDATASAPGVEFPELFAHAAQAVEACGNAVRARPENPHFLALLARATFAAGRQTEAVALYRKAADAGDARAMVSLATLMENGDHVAKNLPAAYALYEKAAAKDNPDAAINLGFVLFNGIGIRKDVPRALGLFRKAADLGSATATFNLAKLVSDGVGGEKPAEALGLFMKAADLGYAGAYRAAAIMLDLGKIVPRDVDGAADQILQCVRTDYGECLAELTARTQVWSPDTVRALESRLRAAGYYGGPLNGKSGPELLPALQQWRLQGPSKKA